MGHPKFINELNADNAFLLPLEYTAQNRKRAPRWVEWVYLIDVYRCRSGTKEKFYTRLPELISFLKDKGYEFKSVDHLLD